MVPALAEAHARHKAWRERFVKPVTRMRVLPPPVEQPKHPEPPELPRAVVVVPEPKPAFVPAPGSMWFHIIEEVPGRVRVEDIQREVARHFEVERDDILSERRTMAVVKPRQIAMYLSTRLTHRSLPEIGRRFCRDHTTVLHARRIVECILKDNAPLAGDVRFLEQKLKPQSEKANS